MQILDGKAVSKARREGLKPRVEVFKAKHHREPHLVVVLVGQDPASQVYVRNKQKACASVGIKSTLVELSQSTSQDELSGLIQQLNSDFTVDGILVQLPLPAPLKESEVLKIVSPAKDVDAFGYQIRGALWAGEKTVAPCTPKGVMSILEYYKIPVAGRHAVVVGRSNIVGKPMAHLLVAADATVTLCHSKTKDLSSFTRQGDIVVVAAGKKHLLGKNDFKKEAVVIDVGMHGTGEGSESLAGDVRFEEVKDFVQAITPVPGGVGPMTITTLLENLMSLAEARQSSK